VSPGAENRQPNVGDFQPPPPVLNCEFSVEKVANPCEFSVVTNTMVETINTNTQGYNEFLVSDGVFKLGQQDDCRFRMCVNDETNVSTGCMHVDEDRAWIRGHMHPAFPGLERIMLDTGNSPYTITGPHTNKHLTDTKNATTMFKAAFGNRVRGDLTGKFKVHFLGSRQPVTRVIQVTTISEVEEDLMSYYAMFVDHFNLIIDDIFPHMKNRIDCPSPHMYGVLHS
jgi:hypothetical protein